MPGYYRSRLEPHREEIFKLRREGKTLEDIVAHLAAAHAETVAVSTLHNFILVRIRRPHLKTMPPPELTPAAESSALPVSQAPSGGEKTAVPEPAQSRADQSGPGPLDVDPFAPPDPTAKPLPFQFTPRPTGQQPNAKKPNRKTK